MHGHGYKKKIVSVPFWGSFEDSQSECENERNRRQRRRRRRRRLCMLNIRVSRSTLLLESSRYPTNILDPVTETINNRTEPDAYRVWGPAREACAAASISSSHKSE
jgi:hypothetical protein